MIAIGFVRNEFNIRDKGTWMAPFIRGVLNADNRKKGIENIRFNHVVWLINETVYEAGYDRFKGKACVMKRTLADWLASRSPKGDYEFYQIPCAKFQEVEAEKLSESLLGVPYDFGGVLGLQLIRQITNKTIWLGRKGLDFIRLHCCNSFGYVLYQVLGIKTTKYVLEVDPEDLLNWVKQSNFKEIKI